MFSVHNSTILPKMQLLQYHVLYAAIYTSWTCSLKCLIIEWSTYNVQIKNVYKIAHRKGSQMQIFFKKKNATKSESISNQIQSCKNEKLSENKIYELFVPTSI